MPSKRNLWSVAVGALVLMTMVLAGCGPTSTGGGTSNTPQKGGTVINGLYEEPDTLVPMITNETYSVIVDQSIWAPLWYGDNQGVLHAGIATDVPTVANNGISSDLKTYTIHLKPGLKWSDGSPITADDLKFSLDLYANPDFANTFGFPTTDPADPIGYVSSTKVDDTTVSFTLKNPAVTIPSILADGAGSIVPQKVFSAIKPADIAKSKENFSPSVVSGPFMIKDRVQGDHITVVRNPNYYQASAGFPYLDQVTFKIVPDQSTILADLQSGSVDESWFLDVTKLDAYKAISGYTTASDPHPAGYELLVFNLTNPILADHAVRQALTMSLNLDDLSNKLFKGTAKKTCDNHAGTPYHEDNLIPCYKYDPTGAGQLLDQDGWKMGSDGYRHKNGQLLQLRYSTTNKAVRKSTQLLAQDAWKAIGIKINLENYDANVFFGANAKGILHSGNFDIGEFANTLGFDPDDHTFFASNQTPDKGGSNYMHYSNPTVDAAENQQQQTSDVNARKAAFHTIHAQILQDLPVFYLYSAANIYVYKNTLHNYAPSPLSAAESWNI